MKLTIYLTDPEDVGPSVAAAGPAPPADPPTTTMLVVDGLGVHDLLVEIEIEIEAVAIA